MQELLHFKIQTSNLINNFSVSGDFRERHTLWTQSFGAAFTYISLVGANQTIIQRYITVKKTCQNLIIT